MKAEVRRYLDLVGTVLVEELGPSLSGIFLVGSLASGDFVRARSDIDLLVVCSDPPSGSQKTTLAEALSHRVLPCPAQGLDLVAYPSAQVSPPPRTPRYELSLSTGVQWDDEVSQGGPYPGGLIDLAAARRFGHALQGPAPTEVIGPVDDRWIREELHSSILWHREKIHHPFHDPRGSNAVLNACRALYFLELGRLVSKTEGGRWVAQRNPSDLVARALADRRGAPSKPLPGDRVLDFLEAAAGRFREST